MEHPMARNSFALALVMFCACAPPCLVAWGQADTAQSQETVQAPQIAIGPGDMLSVQVFDTPELSMDTVRVSQNGQVSLPVLGTVDVAGLNTDQAARRIESVLRTRGIMVDPHVIVSVVDYATQGATLLGEVRSPGVYPTFGGRRLLDVIALAGGILPSAGKIVTIAHRSNPQHPVDIPLVQNAQSLGSQQNPIILPGDTIVVAKAGIIYILGDVVKAGGYLIDNNEHVSLMQVLTLAGGWQKDAALSKARLIREVPEGHKELMLDLKQVVNGKQADVSVEDGDILYIPASLGKTIAYEGMQAAVTAAQTAIVYSTINNP